MRGLPFPLLDSGFAAGHEEDTAENQCHGQQLNRGEAVKAKADTDYRRHDGLDVVVDADKRRAEVFLPDHHARIGKVGRKAHDIDYAGIVEVSQ